MGVSYQNPCLRGSSGKKDASQTLEDYDKHPKITGRIKIHKAPMNT